MSEPIPPDLSSMSWSQAYLHAQRSLSAWLDAKPRDAHRLSFIVRNRLMELAAREHAQLARWLAWLLCSRAHAGGAGIRRLARLDSRLASAVLQAGTQLPVAVAPQGKILLTTVKSAG